MPEYNGLSYSGPVFSTPDGEFVIANGGTLTIEAGGVVHVVLPASDPRVVGQLWNDTGAVKVSGG
jgi:hypothetical protein